MPNCNCPKCEGGKNVSQSTYARHAPNRISEEFREFLRRAGNEKRRRLEPVGEEDNRGRKRRRVPREEDTAAGSSSGKVECVLAAAPNPALNERDGPRINDPNNPDTHADGPTSLDPSTQRLTADDAPSLLEDTSLPAPRQSTLDKDALALVARENPRHPPSELPDLSDPDVLLSLRVYTTLLENSAENRYTRVRAGILRRYPDSEMLSHEQVKERVEELGGVSSRTLKHIVEAIR